MTDEEIEKKLSESYVFVRQLHFSLHDQVQTLMTHETDLEIAIETADLVVGNLNAAISAVENVGGDTKGLVAQHAQHYKESETATTALINVQKELSRIRAVMKHIDNAYDGLHWGCLEASRLRQFKKEKNNV